MSGETLGDRVKKLREAKGWELDELAFRSNTSRSYIYYLETSQRKDISAPKLQGVADALGTTVDYLLTGKDTLIDLEKLDPELQEIYAELLGNCNILYRKSGEIDKEGLRAIISFIKFIKQDADERDKRKLDKS